MKKSNYLFDLNEARRASRFNMIFEDIMGEKNLFSTGKNVSLSPNKEKRLQLIMEEIQKPQYVVCESTGDCILLEDAIFMDEQFLITEGILDTVKNKVQQIVNYIKQGIQKVLQESSDMIQKFCQKVKNNPVVAAIRKKLGLDDKLKAENFKQFIKVTKAKGATAAEAVSTQSDGIIITEATKLSEKEQAISDPEEAKKYMQAWNKKFEEAKANYKAAKEKNPETDEQKAALKKLKGKAKYYRDKVLLFQKKIQTMKSESGDATTKDDSKKEATLNYVGNVYFKVDGMQAYVTKVKEEVLSEKAIDASTESVVTATGGAEVLKAEGGQGQEKKEEQTGEKKKQGFFDKIGNKIKDKIKAGSEKVKKWFNAQNNLVKALIVLVIAVLVLLALKAVIVGFVFPILANILTGGVGNAVARIFQIVISGKVFKATYKAGKKAWDTGEGWGKAFGMIGLSILAIIGLKSIADTGAISKGGTEAAAQPETVTKDGWTKGEYVGNAKIFGDGIKTEGGHIWRNEGAPADDDAF